MITTEKPRVGDRVSIFVPGQWQRFGTVTATDYHPLGVDDAVQIRFDDAPVTGPPHWWDFRWVMVESQAATALPDDLP